LLWRVTDSQPFVGKFANEMIKMAEEKKAKGERASALSRSPNSTPEQKRYS